MTHPFASSSPAKIPLLKERAYAELKQLVVSGEFPPGAFLSERQLAAQLGMSKTPIRAALERLEAEGFIAVSPQQGIVVRELSLAEISDHLEIRMAIEPFVVRRIAGRLTSEQRSELEANLAAQQRAAAGHDVAQSSELDAEFHLLLCDALGNREIRRVMGQLRDRMHRVILELMHRQSLGRLFEAQQEHAEIAAAILEADPDRAAARMQAHLEFGRRVLLS
jgi:DNA-binding GntR family transcriptional regulator